MATKAKQTKKLDSKTQADMDRCLAAKAKISAHRKDVKERIDRSVDLLVRFGHGIVSEATIQQYESIAFVAGIDKEIDAPVSDE